MNTYCEKVKAAALEAIRKVMQEQLRFHDCDDECEGECQFYYAGLTLARAFSLVSQLESDVDGGDDR